MGSSGISGRDFVIVAPQSWDFEIGSNARNIAIELAKDNRVLYVNPPLDRKSSFFDSTKEKVKYQKRIIANKEKGLVQVGKNIWNLFPNFLSESINWIGITTIYDYINERDNRQFAKCISEACHALGFNKILLFNDNFIFKGLYLNKYLSPSAYIYYIRDFLVTQPYFKKHGARLEPQLMRSADLVVANSLYLKEYAEKHNDNSFYVGQGCEVEIFDENLVENIPEDIRSIPHPVIGYVGFLTSMRLDIDLLIAISTSMPEWSIVLVGPEDDVFMASQLHSFNNVYFLGKKNPADLPSYINFFDVCINPQIVNQLTIGNYPRKIDEYLAMGKPVVATKTKAMEPFGEHVYLATAADEYLKCISESLTQNNESQRLSRKLVAQSHTWKNSVREIYRVIELISVD